MYTGAVGCRSGGWTEGLRLLRHIATELGEVPQAELAYRVEYLGEVSLEFSTNFIGRPRSWLAACRPVEGLAQRHLVVRVPSTDVDEALVVTARCTNANVSDGPCYEIGLRRLIKRRWMPYRLGVEKSTIDAPDDVAVRAECARGTHIESLLASCTLSLLAARAVPLPRGAGERENPSLALRARCCGVRWLVGGAPSARLWRTAPPHTGERGSQRSVAMASKAKTAVIAAVS